MNAEPSTTADETESIGRIVTKLLPATATILVATLAVVGVAIAGLSLAGSVAGANDTAEAATVTESDVEAADVVVEPQEATVTVPVDLDDGETVTIRIRSASNASHAFIMNEETTIEDGEASASINLSQAVHGDRATLTVRGNEALDEPITYEMLVVDEEIGVEESGGILDTEAPGFGVVAAGVALLAAVLTARRWE